MVKLKQSTDYLLHLGASNVIFTRAKALRYEMTATEKILWKALRNRKQKTFKFRRQHPIGQFIADFYCHEARLIIEIDGEIHNQNTVSEHDEGRTQQLNRMGITVIRFKNDEITEKLDWVLEEIGKYLKSTSPRPSPQGEGVAS